MADNLLNNSPTVKVLDHETRQLIDVPREQLHTFITNPRYGIRKDEVITSFDEYGQLVGIPAEQAATAFGQAGYRPATSAEIDTHNKQIEFGDKELQAGLAGAARTLSFGASDQVLTKTGLVKPETLAGLAEVNPIATGVGEAIGVAAPIAVEALSGVGAAAIPGTLASVAAKTPTALLSKQAAKVTAGVAKQLEKAALQEGLSKTVAKSIVGKVAPAFVGSAVEGAAFGAGQSLSEDALGHADFNAENLLAHVGTGAILGGALGVAGEGLIEGSKIMKGGIKNIFKKGPLSGFSDPEKALAGLVGGGQNVEKVLRENLSPEQWGRAVQLMREKNLAKPISSATDLIKGLDDMVDEFGSVLKSAKSEGAIAAKEANLNYNVAETTKQAIDNLEEQFLKPFGVTSRDFSEREIKQLRKMKIPLEEANLLKLEADRAAIRQQLADGVATPELANQLAAKDLQLEQRFINLSRKVDDAKLVKSGQFAANSSVESVKLAKDAIDGLRKELKMGTSELPLEQLHGRITDIDNLLKKAYQSGEFTVKQDVQKAVRDTYREMYNSKIEQLVQAGKLSADVGGNLIQKNKDFATAIGLRELTLKNLRGGQEFKAANLIPWALTAGVSSHFGAHPIAIAAFAGKTFTESDFRRRLALHGYLETANNATGKLLNKTATALSGAVKVSTKGAARLVPFQASPLSVFEGKKPKSEKDALLNIGKQLDKLADPEQAINYSNKRTMLLADQAPKTAAAIDAKVAQGLAFLKSKYPQQLQRGFAQKQGAFKDSDVQVFKRYYNSVMNPQYAINAVYAGTAGKPEIETLQVVYPTIYAQLQESSAQFAIAAKQQPKYSNRGMLTKVTGAVADHSYNQKMVQKLQQSFLQTPQSAMQKGPGRPIKVDVGGKYVTDYDRILGLNSKK